MLWILIILVIFLLVASGQSKTQHRDDWTVSDRTVKRYSSPRYAQRSK
jgi:hypothetical protein